MADRDCTEEEWKLIKWTQFRSQYVWEEPGNDMGYGIGEVLQGSWLRTSFDILFLPHRLRGEISRDNADE